MIQKKLREYVVIYTPCFRVDKTIDCYENLRWYCQNLDECTYNWMNKDFSSMLYKFHSWLWMWTDSSFHWGLLSKENEIMKEETQTAEFKILKSTDSCQFDIQQANLNSVNHKSAITMTIRGTVSIRWNRLCYIADTIRLFTESAERKWWMPFPALPKNLRSACYIRRY